MIRGRTLKTATPAQQAVDFNASIHNRFDVEVVDAKTGEIKSSARGFNTICNNLWSRLFSGSSYFSTIAYGQGSGIPSPEDTNLFSRLGGSTPNSADDVVAVDYNSGVFSYRRKIQLSESTAAGKTITEVGIEYTSSNGLCTHALLEDMNGNPISILKTDSDIVNIYATIFIHFVGGGFDRGSIKMNYYDPKSSLLSKFAGVSPEYPPNYFLFSSELGFLTNDGSSDLKGIKPSDFVWNRDTPNSENKASLTYSYDAENKTIKLKASRLGVSAGNMGGILRFLIAYYRASWGTYNYHQLLPSMDISVGGSWFPYSEIKNEAVGTGDGVTTDFSLDFPYAHDAEVYVDGALTRAVTVDYAVNTAGSIQHKVLWLSPDTVSQETLIPAYNAWSAYISATERERMFYNPMFALGLYSLSLRSVTLYASNDLLSWEEVTSVDNVSTTYVIPDKYSHHKYWKGVHRGLPNCSFVTPELPEGFTGKTLHFDSAPAEGATITASYRSDCFAKDENHVFDLSVTFHFGEYTES